MFLNSNSYIFIKQLKKKGSQMQINRWSYLCVMFNTSGPEMASCQRFNIPALKFSCAKCECELFFGCTCDQMMDR